MENCSSCLLGTSQSYGWEPSKEPWKFCSLVSGHLFQVFQTAAGKQRDKIYLTIFPIENLLLLCFFFFFFKSSYNELNFKEYCSQPEGIGRRLGQKCVCVCRSCPPWDIWQYLETFLTVTTWGVLLASSGI